MLEAINDARNENEVVVQAYIMQKSFSPAIYRFYRNENNIYKAECITNTKNPFIAYPTLKDQFESSLEEVVQRVDHRLVPSFFRSGYETQPIHQSNYLNNSQDMNTFRDERATTSYNAPSSPSK